jgi:ribosomal protein L11 methyltransferase
MSWLELSLSIDAKQQQEVEAALEKLGALSITLLDADAETPDERAIFEPGVGETPIWKALVLNALFESDADRSALVSALREALPELSPEQIIFREVADQNWERVWMDRFQPMRFGRRLWIYPWNIEPPGKTSPHPLPSTASGGGGASVALRATDLPDDETVVVRLDPGLAFGTGTHPTTALCLEWLDALGLRGQTIMDYGCGSGVLAIAALKLGAMAAIGVDNDPQALTASRDNAGRNGVADRLALYAPDALPKRPPCDALVANILAGPLLDLAPVFAALLKPGAPFALSGILAEQQHGLVERYQACGFVGLRVTQREDWIRIDGQRHP